MTLVFSVDVYEANGSTFIASVPAFRGATWQDELNTPGSGQFDVHLDTVVQDGDGTPVPLPTLLADLNVVKFSLASGAVKAWTIERVAPVTVSGEEKAGRWVTVSGGGIGAWLETATVYPEYGILRAYTSDDRAFTFASADGPWRVTSEWATPAGVRQDSDPTARAHAPKGWADGAAEWIWSSDPTASAPIGTNWFRGVLTLAAATDIVLSATADNFMLLYVDSELVAVGDVTDPYGWRTTYQFGRTLAAGVHTIAAAVDNQALASGLNNPGGFLCSVAVADDQGEPSTTVLLRSNTADWLVKAYGDPPGWFGGSIVKQLVTEAQARSVEALTHITLGFSDTVDSAGATWTNREDRKLKVGEDYLAVLTQISELELDWDVTPDRVLNLWQHRGADRRADVTLLPGGNVLRAESTIAGGKIRNQALIKYGYGWIEASDSASITAHGRRETSLQVGNADSPEHAQSVAAAAFNESAQSEITIPVQTTSAAGPQPYVDFFVGDTITAPAPYDGLAAGRVMRITGSVGDGVITWDIDLYPED